MAGDQNHSIKGDRALSVGDEDRLGFREVAKRIAISLVDRASEGGLVIGLEGAWGSGKSSLLFLIEEELRKLPDEQQPTVISFRPWLIGNRDALISSIFGELSKALDQAALDAGDATGISVAKAKEAGEALRSFVSGLGKAGAAIEFVGKVSGIGLIELAGQGVKAAGDAASKEPAAPQLSELKEKLVSLLRELGHRFIITIDDVDRLEPDEVIEIMRLVRSVVDLPNVIYLLCYDSKILAHSIRHASGVKSGKSYLEKIIQLTIMVPNPEPLQLRQWFTDELYLIASAKDDEELSRLKTVIDYEGGRRLQTPRSVVRALDAIRFFWPPLRDARADLADLVWIQLIKDGNPALYRWIENYVATASVVLLGTASVSEADQAELLSDLIKVIDKGYFSDTMYRYYFKEQLPGVEPAISGDDVSFKLFESISEQKRGDAIRNKRLSSPDHYRLYFALKGPSHAITQSDFAKISEAAFVGVDQVGAAVLALHDQTASGSLTKADLLLDRIKSGAYEALTPRQCENLVIALSHVMDEAYQRHPFDQFWVNSVWDRAQRLVPLLLSPLKQKRRASAIESMFARGAAIGWLTSIFRHETFVHGRYGDRRRPEADWLFTDPELDTINKLMIARYQAMSLHDVLASPSPINILFAWRQGGDEDGPRRLVENNIRSGRALIDTLERMCSRMSSSSRGELEVLKRENLEPFMNYDDVRDRVGALEKNSKLGSRASRLVAAFREGAEW